MLACIRQHCRLILGCHPSKHGAQLRIFKMSIFPGQSPKSPLRKPSGDKSTPQPELLSSPAQQPQQPQPSTRLQEAFEVPQPLLHLQLAGRWAPQKANPNPLLKHSKTIQNPTKNIFFNKNTPKQTNKQISLSLSVCPVTAAPPCPLRPVAPPTPPRRTWLKRPAAQRAPSTDRRGLRIGASVRSGKKTSDFDYALWKKRRKEYIYIYNIYIYI